MEAVIVVLTALWILAGASVEFHSIASGTGTWVGEMSPKWALGLAAFVLLAVLCLVGTVYAVRPGGKASWTVDALSRLRDRLGAVRWLLAAIVLAAPVLLLQYTSWGVVIGGPYLRVFIWCIAGVVLGFLLGSQAQGPMSWRGLLVGFLVSGAANAIAAAFTNVTSYPFSLGWSEGNRLWDYSLFFGKRLYAYSATDVPSAYLDIGRQLIGGLPFLLPRVSILGERLWIAAMGVLPYLLLGFSAFWPYRSMNAGASSLAAIWSFMFLAQGPIHSPLLLCAALVAIAWRLPLGPSAVLLLISGYSAEVSRFTWMFAPALWIAMLELASATAVGSRIAGRGWRRALLLAGAGIAGAATGIISGTLASGGTSLGTATAASTSQALLWYRLLPNATYGNGILLGLAIAAGPLLVWLIVARVRAWKLSWLQTLSVTLPLVAFLAVGIVVSTKIGGGGDLHNLDMFLIGLVFATALVWMAVGADALTEIGQSSPWLRLLTMLLIAVPAYQPLITLRPLSFSQDAAWLGVLTGVDRARDMGSLPDDAAVRSNLEQLVTAVQKAQPSGEVLFMDQRQLLTFGYVQNVPLVAAYEKKLLMDQALSGNRGYFQGFYKDLAAHRFALIVSSPLRTPIRDSEYGFGEENNAWVAWVAKPILCYYQEQDTLNDVKVELLVPRGMPADCTASLP
jgi:hypothetical protein